jgi:hypothetical protein
MDEFATHKICRQGVPRWFGVDFPSDFRIWLQQLTQAIRGLARSANMGAKPHFPTLKRLPDVLDRPSMCAAARIDPSEPHNVALV